MDMDKKKAGILITVFAVVFGALIGLSRAEDKKYSYKIGK